MITRRLALVGLLMAQSAAAPRLAVPDAPDVMVKTRRTMGGASGAVVTETLYLKGARQRRDTIYEVPPQPGAGIREAQRSGWVYISQCDERRTLVLNHDAKTYVYEPIEDPGAIIARLSAGAKRQDPSRQVIALQTLTITTDAVDTGERRQFGRYVARHVITTRTTAPEPGMNEEVRTDTQDGWYIDVPEVNCGTWKTDATFIAGSAGSGRSVPNVQFTQRGTARRGYPIEETSRFSGRHAAAAVSKVELIELSEAPLDDALFTVPSGYRAALPMPYGGYDLSKPDTVMNRLESYRQVASDWANYIRRNGLLATLREGRSPIRF